MSLTDDQKAMRRSGIGGSEVAALVGLSRWATPLDIWRRKVEGWETEDTPALRRGRILEPAVCQLYQEESGALELRESGTLRHLLDPLALATPDRIARFPGGERLLEAKTAHRFASAEWGEPGTDDIPAAYLAQVVWTLGVADLETADVAVLLGGELAIYRVVYDAALDAHLHHAAARFWADYVLPKRPPPPDASSRYSEWLQEQWPRHRAPLRQATAEEVKLVSTLRTAEAHADAASDELERLRNALRLAIGDAEGFQGPGFKATWRRAKDSARVDWEAVAKEAGADIALISRHTTIRDGSRRLLVQKTKVTEEDTDG